LTWQHPRLTHHKVHLSAVVQFANLAADHIGAVQYARASRITVALYLPTIGPHFAAYHEGRKEEEFALPGHRPTICVSPCALLRTMPTQQEPSHAGQSREAA
jgi:hypothetical protein